MPKISQLTALQTLTGTEEIPVNVGGVTEKTTPEKIYSFINGKDSGWITPTLLNGWANYGGTWETVRFKKYSDGLVEIRGLAAQGAISVNAFVLPVGFRPLKDILFANETITQN